MARTRKRSMLFRAAPMGVALFLVCAVLAGCGGGDDGSSASGEAEGAAAAPLPADAIARVGDVEISKERFDRWFKSAAKPASKPLQPTLQISVASDYPKFASCVATQEKRGAPTAAARADCKAGFDGFMTQVMNTLIEGEWIRQAAQAEGLTASTAELKRAMEKQKRVRAAAGAEAPAAPGKLPAEEMRFLTETNLLQKKLLARVLRITDADIRRYFEAHPGAYIEPDRRRARLVFTKSRADAQKARRRLAAGESFAAVRGGLSPKGSMKEILLERTPQMEGFQKAVYDAEKGELAGPARDGSGWYVFEVVKVETGGATLSPETKKKVRVALKGELEQTESPKYFGEVGKRSRAQTVCRKGYVIPLCGDTYKD